MRRCRADIFQDVSLQQTSYATTQKFLQWLTKPKNSSPAPSAMQANKAEVVLSAPQNSYIQYWKQYPPEENGITEPVLDIEKLAQDFGENDQQKMIEIKIATRIYVHYVRNSPINKKEEDNFSNAKYILKTHDIDADALLAARESRK
jgi:hypothetical protein